MRTLTILLATLMLTLTACGEVPPVDETPDAGQTDSGTDPVVDWAFGDACEPGESHCYGADIYATCLEYTDPVTWEYAPHLLGFRCPGGCTEGADGARCDWSGSRVGDLCPPWDSGRVCDLNRVLRCQPESDSTYLSNGHWVEQETCYYGVCEEGSGGAVCPDRPGA